MVLVQLMVTTLFVAGSIALCQITALLFDGSLYVSRYRICIAIGLPLIIAKRALSKRSLDFGGAIASFFVGFVITLHSYSHVFAMITFFVTSSAWTKFRQNEKRKLESDFKEGGSRSWKQVICNGGVAVLFCLLSLIGTPDLVLGSERRLVWLGRGGEFHRSIWYDLVILGSIACAAGDTWASEIGAAVATKEPWLITEFRRVPRGTNGAVSAIGFVSSIAGGAAVGVAYWLAVLLMAPPDRPADTQIGLILPQWSIIIVCAFAGLAGSLVDSVLGATLQYSGYNTATGCIVETPGPNVRRISGRKCMDNNSVNLVSSFVLGLLTPAFAELLMLYYAKA